MLIDRSRALVDVKNPTTVGKSRTSDWAIHLLDVPTCYLSNIVPVLFTAHNTVTSLSIKPPDQSNRVANSSGETLTSIVKECPEF